ncbi:ASCH domain-containing protein [Cohnella abietis]|uniref:ASCH domain-containing protein n=1 Tax=Cohnella abietis TaxID=2507935 RepID=A0A3T1D8S1_9BACL|nr:ASCH domain-containing protein [Cohnella abietis]BBI34492.1 hypothetical protein KCTCHS21_38910 [Cohnella abietis]
MKAITIHQPWATLIALGEKKYETRSWATKHRGPLAIHAGMKIDREACERESIKSTLAKHGYTADNLPTGAIVAITNLRECYKVHRDILAGLVLLHAESTRTYLETLSNEYHFGDYGVGRFAWRMKDVRRLIDPVPAKGQQGLWNWNYTF